LSSDDDNSLSCLDEYGLDVHVWGTHTKRGSEKLLFFKNITMQSYDVLAPDCHGKYKDERLEGMKADYAKKRNGKKQGGLFKHFPKVAKPPKEKAVPVTIAVGEYELYAAVSVSVSECQMLTQLNKLKQRLQKLQSRKCWLGVISFTD
jgi:hypothetical protein